MVDVVKTILALVVWTSAVWKFSSADVLFRLMLPLARETRRHPRNHHPRCPYTGWRVCHPRCHIRSIQSSYRTTRGEWTRGRSVLVRHNLSPCTAGREWFWLPLAICIIPPLLRRYTGSARSPADIDLSLTRLASGNALMPLAISLARARRIGRRRRSINQGLWDPHIRGRV